MKPRKTKKKKWKNICELGISPGSLMHREWSLQTWETKTQRKSSQFKRLPAKTPERTSSCCGEGMNTWGKNVVKPCFWGLGVRWGHSLWGVARDCRKVLTRYRDKRREGGRKRVEEENHSHCKEVKLSLLADHKIYVKPVRNLQKSY